MHDSSYEAHRREQGSSVLPATADIRSGHVEEHGPRVPGIQYCTTPVMRQDIVGYGVSGDRFRGSGGPDGGQSVGYKIDFQKHGRRGICR